MMIIKDSCFLMISFDMTGASVDTIAFPDLPPVPERVSFRDTVDGRGASEDCETYRPYPAPADGQVRWLQEEPRMRYLHGGVCDRGCGAIPALHAHLPHVMH